MFCCGGEVSSRFIIVSQEREHQVFHKVEPSTNKEEDP